MQHSFEYMYTTTSMDSFSVENIGDCFINMLNDNADEWYLKVSTTLGESVIESFGPLTADSEDFGNSFNYNRNKIQYNEQYLIKFIDKFINDSKKNITQIFEIDEETYSNRIKNILKNI